MQYAELLRGELDLVLHKAAPEWCASVLRRITDLFLHGVSDYSDEHVALYDVAINRLVSKLGGAELCELSRRLASVDHAPPETIGYLARHGNIRVAGPVLEKSGVVTALDLAQIAAGASPAHLLAIAGRPQIGKDISDVLIDRGNSEVIFKILGNAGACFSEIGFVKLITEAKKDKALANLIADRQDLPEELRSFLSLSLA